jgi:hypothetical protein
MVLACATPSPLDEVAASLAYLIMIVVLVALSLVVRG